MWITDKNGYRYLCDPKAITNVTSIKKTWLGDFVFTVTWIEVIYRHGQAHKKKLVFEHFYQAIDMRNEIIEAVNKAK